MFMLGKVQWKDIGYEILHGARDLKRGLCFPEQKTSELGGKKSAALRRKTEKCLIRRNDKVHYRSPVRAALWAAPAAVH